MKKRILPIVVLWFLSVAVFAKDYHAFDIVGDSISEGVNPATNPRTGHGWAQMLFGSFGHYTTIYKLWPGITAYNSAVASSTASQWADPLYAPMQLLLDRHPDLVVVYIGANDAVAYGADGVITIAEILAFRASMETIIDRLRANTPSPDIIMVNYYDPFDGLSDNLTGSLAALRYTSTGALLGNELMRQIAEERGCFFVGGVADAFLHHCYGAELGDTDHLSPDYVATPLVPNFDLHPVTAGHEAIYDQVIRMLRVLKGPGVARAKAWELYE